MLQHGKHTKIQTVANLAQAQFLTLPPGAPLRFEGKGEWAWPICNFSFAEIVAIWCMICLPLYRHDASLSWSCKPLVPERAIQRGFSIGVMLRSRSLTRSLHMISRLVRTRALDFFYIDDDAQSVPFRLGYLIYCWLGSSCAGRLFHGRGIYMIRWEPLNWWWLTLSMHWMSFWSTPFLKRSVHMKNGGYGFCFCNLDRRHSGDRLMFFCDARKDSPEAMVHDMIDVMCEVFEAVHALCKLKATKSYLVLSKLVQLQRQNACPLGRCSATGAASSFCSRGWQGSGSKNVRDYCNTLSNAAMRIS